MKYSLVGINGNEYTIMAYVYEALRDEGLNNLVEEYLKKATSDDYDHLLVVSREYLDKANEKAIENGWEVATCMEQ